MSDSIDHVAVAQAYIADALGAVTADPAVIVALLAQSHATLALVEQQRIANLIALGYGPHTPCGGGVGGFASRPRGARSIPVRIAGVCPFAASICVHCTKNTAG